MRADTALDTMRSTIKTPGKPIPKPRAARSRPSLNTRRVTSVLRAPSAMRTPISWVRLETEKAMTPYMPTAARTTARIPNPVSMLLKTLMLTKN